MRFLIVTPAPVGSTKGNRITAQRWGKIIQGLGHHVSIQENFNRQNRNEHFDVLVALHARKSANSVRRFHLEFPDSKIVVAFTGTDIHLDLASSTQEDKTQIAQTLNIAHRVVLLEPESAKLLSNSVRQKSVVIIQSESPLNRRPRALKRWFEVSVIGHLRPVKDPFRAALAARQLPPSSRVRIVHFGAALTAEMKRMALREQNENPRYRWFGAVDHAEAKRRLARSRLTVLSSKSEGGPAVVSEAIVNDVPILATRMDATIGLLGKDFPGLFEFGNTNQLCELINRCETDNQFYKCLIAKGKRRKKQFSPSTESKAWFTLIRRLKEI